MNWQSLAEEIHKCGWNPILTLESKKVLIRFCFRLQAVCWVRRVNLMDDLKKLGVITFLSFAATFFI
jgi:hypothetical protein